MKALICTVLFFVLGCQGASITAVNWNSNITAPQVRCERVDMRDKADLDRVFNKYDGWKMVYLSEYTTANKTGTDGAVCFERAK